MDERQRRHPDPLLPALCRVIEDPAVMGMPGTGDELHPGHAIWPGAPNAVTAKSRTSMQHRRVVIARDDYDRRHLGQVSQRTQAPGKVEGAGR